MPFFLVLYGVEDESNFLMEVEIINVNCMYILGGRP